MAAVPYCPGVKEQPEVFRFLKDNAVAGNMDAGKAKTHGPTD
jgi:hypothetical protein